MAAIETVVRVLETNDSYHYRTEDTEPLTPLDRANLDAARSAFNTHRRSGGTALAKATADAPFKNVVAFPEDALEVVLLPRVAGG